VVPTPGVPELEAAVVDELAAAELVPAADDELLLLLPQPAIAAITSSEAAMESKLLHVRIAFLLIGFRQKTGRSIGNNASTGWKF
jgi:hypothetical protein